MKSLQSLACCFLLFLAVACSDDDDAVATPRPLTFSYDFTDDADGWTGNFADYPVGEEDFYELAFDYTTLPAPLDEGEGALRQSGNNHSDDLLMYASRQIDGLVPGGTYRATFALRIASDAPDSSFGVGGSPGASVYLKAGLLGAEPTRTVDALDYYRVEFDKGNQAQGGSDMIVLGNFSNGTDESAYALKTLSNPEPLTATADADGRLWLVIGTDSGFESTTSIYYDAVTLSLQ